AVLREVYCGAAFHLLLLLKHLVVIDLDGLVFVGLNGLFNRLMALIFVFAVFGIFADVFITDLLT
ncbi:hypothetical protein ACNITQ_26830, partial [Escherichia coli]